MTKLSGCAASICNVALLLAGLMAGASASVQAVPVAQAVVTAPADAPLTAAITAELHVRVVAAATPAPLRRALETLYPAGRVVPRWLDDAGRAGANAADALALLAQAPAEGLAAGDYRAGALAEGAAALAASPSPAAAAAWDVDLSLAVLRYLRDLHLGRVDPGALGFRVGARTVEPDFAALQAAALADHRLPALAAELAPTLGQYRNLRSMLARYRALAAEPFAPLPPVATTLRSGDAYAGADALRRRLIAFGDLAADAATAPSLFDETLAEGLRSFQRRHGLTADGALGTASLLALNVPPSHRVRQIELALERIRWLPRLAGQRWVAINIPMFRLWAWDGNVPAPLPTKKMNVIVGRALLTQTPVFVEDMRYLIFRPYWNVPTSIVRNEILPVLRTTRDPSSYLERHDMEIVRGGGDDAQPVEASAANLALLHRGALRLRQRPGPRNSLGLVKFVFPNDTNVYLHGTPAPRLFERSRRDFSHGCVRVEDPTGLAEWALREQPRWTRERIEAAMTGAKPLRVDLTRPIRVMLFYVTAVVDGGTIRFAEDIYRHDVRLERALAERSGL